MLIAITGEIGSGKSTLANILINEHKFTEETFAKPLKQFASLLGFAEHQIYGTQEQKLEINDYWNVSGREFLQKFGSEICRDELSKVIPNMNMNGRSLWCRVMEKKILENKNLVVSDLRFEDEYDLIKAYKGIVIKIVRNDNLHNKNGSHNKHISETQMSKIIPDFTIENNTSIEDLKDKINTVLECMKL